MKTDIFIAYRRNEGGYEIAGRMYERLTRLGYRCFWDENLGSGDYEEHINKEINACIDFIIVLPINSLKKREVEKDYFIDEIALALKLKKNIIPVLLDGYDPGDDIENLGEDFYLLRKLEHPMRIFRPQNDKKKKDFQKSVFNATINDMESRKLLKSKKIIQYKTQGSVFLGFFVGICFFLLFQIKLLARDILLRETNQKLSQQLFDIENQIDYWDGNITDSYESGDGTHENPYVISTPQQLALLAVMVNHGESYENTYFSLEKDLYLNVNAIEQSVSVKLPNDVSFIEEAYMHEWTPIGNEEYAFSGHFIGNNKTIYGLYISTEESYQGLFGRCDARSVISGLNIDSSYINAAAGKYVSVLCGCSDGLLDSCYVQNIEYLRGGGYVGGIAGKGDVILNCGAYKIWDIYADYMTKYDEYTTSEEKFKAADYMKERFFGGLAGYCNIVANSEAVGVKLTEPGYISGGVAGVVALEAFNCLSEVTIGGDGYKMVNYVKKISEYTSRHNETKNVSDFGNVFPYVDNFNYYISVESIYKEDCLTTNILKSNDYDFLKLGKEDKVFLNEKNCVVNSSTYVYDNHLPGLVGFAGSNDEKSIVNEVMHNNYYNDILYTFEISDYLQKHNCYIYHINCHDSTLKNGEIVYNSISSGGTYFAIKNIKEDSNYSDSLMKSVLDYLEQTENVKLLEMRELWEQK